MPARTSMRSSERGATAVMVALMIAALCSLLGLVLNVGHLMSVRSELQTAADSAALAGAQQLAAIVSPLTGYPDLTQAALVTNEATTYSGYNPSDRALLAITSGAVSIGIWDPVAKTFTVSSNATQVNAVRANVDRASTPAGPVQIAMASLMGSSATRDVSASAVAVVGGRCNINCTGFPVAIISCGPVTPMCGQTIFIDIKNISTNAQWTDYGLGNADPYILGLLSPGQGCSFGTLQIGDCSVNKVPGVKNNALQYIQNNLVGQEFIVPVICNTSLCANGNSPISGFVAITVVSVTRTGNPQGITVQVTCGSESIPGNQGGGGCVANGSWYLRPRLVQ